METYGVVDKANEVSMTSGYSQVCESVTGISVGLRGAITMTIKIRLWTSQTGTTGRSSCSPARPGVISTTEGTDRPAEQIAEGLLYSVGFCSVQDFRSKIN